MKKITGALAAMGLLLSLAACSGGAADPVITVAATAGIEAQATEAIATTVATTVATATATPEPPPPTATELPATATPLPATETPSPAPTEAPSSTPEPTAEPTLEPTPAAEVSPPAERAQVTIQGSQFSPAALSVRAGATVVWTNAGGSSHTVTADDGLFASETLGEGDVFSFTFDTPGVYAYYCRFHGGAGGRGMSGVITVTE